jgi:thiamine transporter
MDGHGRVRLYAELALAVALGVVLDLVRIPLPHLLYGGSVSLEGLPILVVAFRRGGAPGAAAGAVYGLMNFMLRPVVVHPAQLVLDYPLAFGLLGWGAGLLGGPTVGWGTGRWWRGRLRIGAGVVLGNGLRLAAHFVSGIVFFAAYAPAGEPVWLYSLLYNASYMLPQAVLQILLAQVLLRILVLRGRPDATA